MKENSWETGPDDEELFEFAMHETTISRFINQDWQKKRFEEELEKLRLPKVTTSTQKTSTTVKEEQVPNRNNYTKGAVENPSGNTCLLAPFSK